MKNSAFCEIFHSSHSAEKSRKGFPQNSKKFFSALETRERTNLASRKIKIFQEIIWQKKSHNAEKHKKRPLWLIHRFLQTDNSKKFKVVPFDRIQKCSGKSCIVPKNPKGPFGPPSKYGNIKKFVV